MTPMIAPVLALVVWTLVVWVWMYALRIPAVQAAGLTPEQLKDRAVLQSLPAPARQVADNYNHLHEQPTIFYAAALAIQIAGAADTLSVGLAWAYVVVRVVHSLVQNTTNAIMLRFPVFVVGSLILAAMAVRGLAATL